MRGVAFAGVLLAGLALGGCVRDPFVTTDGETKSGEWFITHQVDRVTGAELPSAILFAYASNSYEDFPKTSSITLTCFDKQPIVRFAFEFKIGTNRNVVLGYRFDDRPGHENVPVRVVMPGQQVIVVEDKAAVALFVSEIRSARKLYMRIRSFNSGRSSAEYDLEGSEPAIQAAYANCPLQPVPATPPKQGS